MTLRILYGSITPRGSPRRSFCLRLSRYGLYGSLRLCKPMYKSPRRSFRSSTDPLQLHITLRPCSSIYKYPHKPAGQSTTPFRHLRTPLRACRIQIHTAEPLESLYRRFADALQTLYRCFYSSASCFSTLLVGLGLS